MHAAGITCSQRLGDITAGLHPGSEEQAVALLGGQQPVSIPLAALEDIIDASGAAPAIEALLPAGVRRRQLSVRTLLLGMHAHPGRRPARAPDQGAPGADRAARADQARLGVIEQWKTGPHQLTYRQVEHTFRLVVRALSKDAARRRAGRGAAGRLRRPARGQHPRRAQGRLHRAGRGLDRHRDLVPAAPARHQPVRRPRSLLGAPQLQPARPQRRDVLRLLPVRRHHGRRGERPARPRTGPADDPVLLRPGPGPRPGPRPDRHARGRHRARRHPRRLRLRPPRRRSLGHPAAPGRRRSSSRTCTPTTAARKAPTTARSSPTATCTARDTQPLLELGPLPPGATTEHTAAHDHQAAELARHKLGRITGDDTDGYHRVTCPAAAGKIRCPLRPGLNDTRPGPARDPHPARAPAGLLHPADHHRPPGRRSQDPPKTRLPLAAHRRSYTRRTGAERTFSTIKDPATTSIARGWCRLMGLTPLALWIACLLTVRNQRILAAFDARQADNARRAAAGLPPRTRKRRRQTLASLAAGPP